jgi:hypothetical protein
MLGNGLRSFLGHWFAGFGNGLAQLSTPERDTMLRACAAACGRSYTIGAFRSAWEETGALEPFLRRLEEVFPDAAWERTGPDTLRVVYRRCGCDLVTQGWVDTPLLCGCSVHNLRENLTAALGPGIEVALESSILGGAERCALRVRLPSVARR